MEVGISPGIDRLFAGVEPASPTLAVVNRRAPRQVQEILESLFERQPVRVVERSHSDGPHDVVHLIEHGDIVAVSELDQLSDTVLLVNSDRYTTDEGMGGPLGFPDVLVHLDEVPFTVRGYPSSHREKLLFIAISRMIERRAALAPSGTLRTSFQHVSRLLREPGTRRLYEHLQTRPVELHLYGHGDTVPAAFADTLVLGDRVPHRRCWTVSFRAETDAAALFAVEKSDNTWSGYWTFDRDKVGRINSWIDEHMRL